MLKHSPTWVLPLFISLSLHVGGMLIALNYSQPGKQNPEAQINTVGMLMQSALSAVKPQQQAQQSNLPQTPSPIVNIASPLEMHNRYPAIPAEIPAAVPIIEQTNNKPIAIQPLSKLTRPPAFQQKIESVYPAIEQRMGSQAPG